MARKKKDKRKKGDWYRMSVETLQTLGLLVLFAVLGGLAYWGYQRWDREALKREAARVIAEAEVFLQDVRDLEEQDEFREEIASAESGLREAEDSLRRLEYRNALDAGRRSRALLRSILDAVGSSGNRGEAQFVSVQGDVEYRRGERGAWEQARSRVVLNSGDYVKTGSGGSAEVMFTDRTLYRVRPDTLFLVSATRRETGLSEETIQLKYGWVNLNTGHNTSIVSTPGARAVVGGDSEAVVAYNRESKEGQFAAYKGEVEVASQAGLERTLGALQTVTQKGDLLSETRTLPPPPDLLAPPNNMELVYGSDSDVVLTWEPIPGVRGYALQVSRTRLFVDNLVDVADRRNTRATLGIQGEGSFLWRVAAITDDNLRGPWSDLRHFVVSSAGGVGDQRDKTPPLLVLDDIQSYGSIFIVNGRTDPGSAVVINGESVKVEADGRFTKTVQLEQQGWGFLEVTATDTSGNETVQRHRVFVESA